MKLNDNELYQFVGLEPKNWNLLLSYLDEDSDPVILQLYKLIKYQLDDQED